MTKINGEDVAKEDIAKETEDVKESETKNAAEESEKSAEDTAEETVDAAEEKTEDEAKDAEDNETDAEDGDEKYLRLMADFKNYKKRVEKEKTDLYSYANEKIMTELLNVLDNFERALGQENAGDGFREGMEMIFKQLSDSLEKAGLAEITALGEDFDPKFHNAVMTEETEEYESGKVSGVLQKGYTLNGKVIRPSMVKVVG